MVGTFSLGPDFRVNGNVLVSDRTFFKLFADPRSPASVSGRVELGLIKVSRGADPLTVRSRLESALPDEPKYGQVLRAGLPKGWPAARAA